MGSMKKAVLSAVILAIVLATLLPCGTVRAEKGYDVLEWARGAQLMLETIYSDGGLFIGGLMPKNKGGWRISSREQLKADGYAAVYSVSGAGYTDGVPVSLTYTAYVRTDGGPQDADGELADFIAQYEGRNTRYYLDGRPAVYVFGPVDGGERWQIAHRLLYDNIIVDTRVLLDDPSQPENIQPLIVETMQWININGWMPEWSYSPGEMKIRSAGIGFPGQAVLCFAQDAQKKDITEEVIWSAEGAEADEHGRITVAPDAKDGDTVTVTATTKNGLVSASRRITVKEDPIGSLEWQLFSMGYATGLQMAVPYEESGEWERSGPSSDPVNSGNTAAYYYLNSYTKTDKLWVNMNRTVTAWREMPANRAEAVKYLEGLAAETGGKAERFSMNGWPGIYTVRESIDGGQYASRIVHYWIIYDLGHSAKGLIDIEASFWLADDTGIPEIDRETAMALLSEIRAKDEKVTLTDSDPVPVIREAGEARVITAGEKTAWTLEEAVTDPTLGEVVWEAAGEDGKPVSGINVKDGVLEAGRGIRRVTDLTVRARYKYCIDAAETKVTVLPLPQKVAILSEGTFLYTGGDHALVLSAAGDPAGSEIGTVTWSVDKPEIAELTVNGDGTVTIRALKAGAVKVAAVNGTGKKGAVKYTAGEPVTAVEIEAKGGAKPGKTVTLKAKTTPVKPVCADVEWSIDAGKDIAEISAKGQLKIAKTAPAGTVITVTCKALGAPEPVIAQMKITVE